MPVLQLAQDWGGRIQESRVRQGSVRCILDGFLEALEALKAFRAGLLRLA